ncbi:MerR family transcriptional regulator [Bacillus cereus]|nr:MerR family transcriptional regulator [Bacillus cereus]
MDKKEQYAIGVFSERTGISIRTLHYYDEIGLLNPNKHPSSGHRLYTDQDALILQQIVSLKFLGYSLDEIHGMINRSTFDLSLNEALEIQKKAMEEEKERIETVLKAINMTLTILKEEKEVDGAILMNLIKSIQMEKEQRKWIEQYMPNKVAEHINEKLKEDSTASDKEYIRFTKGVKKMVGKPIADPEVQELVGGWMQIANESICSTMELMDEEMVKQIDEMKKEEFPMPPSPFTVEEEKWLEQVIDYYFMNSSNVDQEREK